MKKYILLLLLSIVLLTGCTSIKEAEVKVIAPSGTPSLALAEYFSTHNITVDYEIVAGSDPLVSAFNNKTHDIIIAPVNLGAKLYSIKPNYLLYKTFVWGNTYLASKEELGSIEDLYKLEMQNKKIVAFGQNSTPGIILKALLKYYNQNIEVEYVDDVATANAMLMSGKADIILTAEPSLSKINSKNDLYILDLQQAWKDMTKTTSYPQAAIFVLKDRVNDEVVQKHLNEIVDSINKTKNLELTATLAVKIDPSFEKLGKDVLKKAIPNCNYGFVEDEVEPIDTYFMILKDLGLENMYGGTLPSLDFYASYYKE